MGDEERGAQIVGDLYVGGRGGKWETKEGDWTEAGGRVPRSLWDVCLQMFLCRVVWMVDWDLFLCAESLPLCVEARDGVLGN
jgi:hypothetical protein